MPRNSRRHDPEVDRPRRDDGRMTGRRTRQELMFDATLNAHLQPVSGFYSEFGLSSEWDYHVEGGKSRECFRRECSFAYNKRRGLQLLVRATDDHGNDVTDDRTPTEWLPEQKVRDVLIEVADKLPCPPWSKIMVYQDSEWIHEDTALGYLADLSAKVELIFRCVPVFHNEQARELLSQSARYAIEDQWDLWKAAREEAERLEYASIFLASCAYHGHAVQDYPSLQGNYSPSLDRFQ